MMKDGLHLIVMFWNFLHKNMEINNEHIILFVLAFSSYVALAPIVALGKLNLRACIYLMLVGAVLVPLSALWVAFVWDASFISVLKIKYEGGKAGILGPYVMFLLGIGLSVTALLRSALTNR